MAFCPNRQKGTRERFLSPGKKGRRGYPSRIEKEGEPDPPRHPEEKTFITGEISSSQKKRGVLPSIFSDGGGRKTRLASSWIGKKARSGAKKTKRKILLLRRSKKKGIYYHLSREGEEMTYSHLLVGKIRSSTAPGPAPGGGEN